MSGRPNKEGIAKVLGLLQKERTLYERAAALRKRIKDSERELDGIERQLGQAEKERQAELEQMDLVHSGNYGHAERMTSFLTELVSLAYEAGEAAPRPMPVNVRGTTA
ncbi:hypothetical protein [Burkholderia gladioli]|uniref:hypothetical protein n=1 Tax=Burkholderia gladioli TaxID=28095 RepID=UPI001640DA81|nr:hypothetical protein [Burkholderia gladioli]